MSGAAAASHGRRLATHEPEHENGERWLLTYSDMITLLLALFIVLFAMSSINMTKFAEFRQGLIHSLSSNVSPVTKGGTGLLQQSGMTNQPNPAVSTPSPPQTPQTQLQAIEARMAAALQANGLSQDVSLTINKQGLVARILSDKVFFAVDSADLGAVGNRVVDVIGGVLAQTANQVSVQGYTDNQPIFGGPYRDNWQLSAERAVMVVERLTGQDHIAPARLAAVGYGDTRPLVPNDTPAHMATNRRVDVVVLADSSASSTPTTVPGATTTTTPPGGK